MTGPLLIAGMIVLVVIFVAGLFVWRWDDEIQCDISWRAEDYNHDD